jgi:IS5 family transposase
VSVVFWHALLALIETHYPKPSKKGGCPQYPLSTMLRIRLLQQCYSLSDPAMEEALIEVPTMRCFSGIELIPDETTILTFRHLLEKHKLGEQIFETDKAHLSEGSMAMAQGTIVDAPLIAALSSNKNKEGKRDPEIDQTMKGILVYRYEYPRRHGQGLRHDPLGSGHRSKRARPHPGSRAAT